MFERGIKSKLMGPIISGCLLKVSFTILHTRDAPQGCNSYSVNYSMYDIMYSLV